MINGIELGLISFRSLLEGSDTISIDTEMVSSQEFLCLLDMIYTGKLPLGKHNVSRIIAAADSLQMFDVAVGFKNILACLVNQQPSSQDVTAHTAAATNLTRNEAEGRRSAVGQEQQSAEHSQGASVPLEEEECEEMPKSSGQTQLFSRALVVRASLLQINA